MTLDTAAPRTCKECLENVQVDPRDCRSSPVLSSVNSQKPAQFRVLVSAVTHGIALALHTLSNRAMFQYK